MTNPNERNDTGDKLLFTPGPLTTSPGVKEAMLRDLGSRDAAFIDVVRDIRARLLALGGVAAGEYEAVPMQGSGTFAIEAVLASTVPPGGKVLVVVNGAYGRRMVQMAEVLGIDHAVVAFPEHAPPDPETVDDALAHDPGVTHVAVVHCETTTGIMNDIETLGAVVVKHNRVFFVDAMSSFGAVPLDLNACHIDYLVSSANKCIEGVPGFAFVLARREALLAAEGYARSLSLDLLAQWHGLEQNGQFRFTPPTHALLAFHRALIELEEEGDVAGRAARYRRNHEVLAAGMTELGFEAYLDPTVQGYIITSYRYPQHPGFDFEGFYQRLNDKGFVIYPGKVSDADCFRVGTIGRLFEDDIRALLIAMGETLSDMGVELRAVSSQ